MSPSPPWAAHKPRSPRACTAHATAAPRVAGSGGPIVKKVRKKHPMGGPVPHFYPIFTPGWHFLAEILPPAHFRGRKRVPWAHFSLRYRPGN